LHDVDGPNGFYKPHYDACCFGSCDTENAKGKQLLTNTQRKKTLLVYLNDNFEGGETIFPNLNTSLSHDEANS
jgi:hypothetical protein